MGFGEKFKDVVRSTEEFAQIGVSTSLVFIRSNSEFMSNRIPGYLNVSVDELVNLHLDVASILVKNGIEFGSFKAAGCTGCNGCNCMKESCDILTTKY